MSEILENKANAVKDLQKKYRLALSIIALLTILSQFAIQYNIHKGADDSRVINIAGRQRMLSQKISKSALAMQFSDSILTKVRYQKDLKKAVDTWKLSHFGLKNGNAELGLPGTNSAKVNEMFEKLESKHQAILYSVDIISKIDLKSLTSDSELLLGENIKRILQYEAQFLKEMDAIVFQYDSEAKAKIEIIKYVEIIILFFTLLVLFLEALYIFRPLELNLLQTFNAYHESETNLKAAKEKAEIANKTKSEFLANMSHEIRTPLNAVIGFSELLRNIVKDDKQKSYIETINIAGEGLLTIINDILDLSKIEAGRLEINNKPANISRLLDELGRIFKQKIESKNLDFQIQMNGDLPFYLIIDEVRLRQVLMNIIGNAIKFTEKGSITLILDMVCPDLVDFSKIDLTIRIKDTGIGIPENQKEIIFESFKQISGQSTKKYGGTGLGLSITKRLVEMMGGEITLESQLNQGSEFIIKFKQIDVSSAEFTDEDSMIFDFNKYIFPNETVLVVDDVESNRELLIELLTKVGLKVETAKNGLEAIQLIQDINPKLVLMDMMMPVMGGFEATKKIRSNPILKDTIIIALTASIHENDEMSKFFNAWLNKPVNFELLLKTLSKYIATKNSEDINNLQNDKATKNSLSPDNFALEYLTKNVLPVITKLEKAMKINIVSAMAKDMKLQGENNNNEYLVFKAGELLKYSNSFDIVNIKTLIQELHNLIDENK